MMSRWNELTAAQWVSHLCCLLVNFRRLNCVWRSLFRRMGRPVVDEKLHIQQAPPFTAPPSA
jgi:hypothetical protein